MSKLDISRLKRDKNIIKSKLKIVKNMTICTDDVMVMFPTRYINSKLCIMGSNIKVVGIYCIISNNKYAVVNAPIMQNLLPNNIEDVEVNGKEYKLLYFDKDTVFIPDNKLIVSDNFVYNIFEELFIKGNIPWYLDYKDVSNIFSESKKYAGSNIGNNSMAFEILTAIISRYPIDLKIYYRQQLDKVLGINPTYVGLNNIYYSFDNTGAKILGSYFGEGIVSAIVDKETKTSTTSEILRS